MMKKGQSLSLSTIVIAALVILVLVVLIFIVLRYVGDFSEDVGACTTQGGVCADAFDGCGFEGGESENYPIPRADLEGCSQGEICCISLG